MSQFLLEGNVDERDGTIAALEQEVERLEGDLGIARAEVAQLRKENARAISALRRQLSPLYQALRQVFGEMDALGGEDPTEAPKADARWESWKKRLPGRPAEMIDLLLLHGSMSVKNLMAAMHCGKDAVYQAASKLGQAGVVTNNGGRYSLKDRP